MSTFSVAVHINTINTKIIFILFIYLYNVIVKCNIMKMFLSEDTTNLGRQHEFDYAKVIAIIFMVLIHVWEELSCFDYHELIPTGFWHNLLQFGAGPLAAPLFMFAMGVGICYSKHRTPKELLYRGISLFLLGYILNIFRNGIYYAIYYGINDNFDLSELIYQLFNGDIFHFAGLTFILVSLFKKTEMPVLVMGGLSIIMQIIGNYLSINAPVSGGLSYIVGHFYFSEKCFFPLLQWFIYPASGIVFAKFLRRVIDKDRFYYSILGISSVLLIGLCSAMYFAGYDIKNLYILTNDSYYKQEFLHSSFTILVILIELSILYFISNKIESDSINNTVNYISNNLNSIYVIQWMLVGTTAFIIMMFNIEKFNATTSILVGFVFVVLSVVISKIYTKLTHKNKH